MFLINLDKKERELFLELATLIAKSDGSFDVEERKMIDTFRMEMNLPKEDYEIKGLSETEIFNDLRDVKNENQKSIFIEILGIALADNEYGVEEKAIMEKMRQEFKILESEEKKIIKTIKTLNECYREFYNFITP